MSATPYPVVIVGLPRSMTYWLAQTLGFDHDVTAWPVADRKPGLCETALYLLPPEEQAKYVGPRTRLIHVKRPVEEVEASMIKLFPGIDQPALRQCLDASRHAIKAFLRHRPHIAVPSPLRPGGLARIAHHLGREAELPVWESALATNRDRLRENAEIREQCRTALSAARFLLLSNP